MSQELINSTIQPWKNISADSLNVNNITIYDTLNVNTIILDGDNLSTILSDSVTNPMSSTLNANNFNIENTNNIDTISINLNGTDLNTSLVTLQTKTQNQSSSGIGTTSFSGSLTADNLISTTNVSSSGDMISTAGGFDSANMTFDTAANPNKITSSGSMQLETINNTLNLTASGTGNLFVSTGSGGISLNSSGNASMNASVAATISGQNNIFLTSPGTIVVNTNKMRPSTINLTSLGDSTYPFHDLYTDAIHDVSLVTPGYVTNDTTGLLGSVSTIPSSDITGLPTFPSSTIVGINDVQTLTNKTMDGASNTFSNIPESAITNLTTDLASKLDLAGGTLSGDINMGTKDIINAGTITSTTVNAGSLALSGTQVSSTGAITLLPTTGGQIVFQGSGQSLAWNPTTNIISGTGGLQWNLQSNFIINQGLLLQNALNNDTDNTYDIGAAGFGRFRTIYLGTSCVTPLHDSSTATIQVGNTASAFIPSKAYSQLTQASQTYAITANAWRLVNNVSTSTFSNQFTNTAGQFRAQYTGTRARIVKVDLNVSLQSSVPTNLVTIMVSKNGNLIPGTLNRSQVTCTLSPTTTYNISLTDMVSVVTNDTLQIAAVGTVTGNLTVVFASITISGELN